MSAISPLAEQPLAEPVPTGRRKAAFRRFLSHPSLVIGCGVLLLLALVAIFAPWLAPNSPTRTSLLNTYAPPSARFPLGTDQFGRCVLSRLIYGSRVSLEVAMAVVAISLSCGTLIGAIAGYSSSWIQRVIVMLNDILLAFPGFLLALAIVAARGSSLESVILAVSVAYIPRVASVMRSVVLTIKPRPFIEASEAIGMGHTRILLRHVIPNALPPVIVVSTVSAASAILAEAGLSFLGLGVQPPTPTWGNIIADGQAAITTTPLISISAGLCIAVTVVALNLLGDGLRDTLDPKMRRQAGMKML
ncbi:ABC transporter permease [Enterovirga sp. CN4-39]|uniref:ABC transporter permease n=1 Tax=Enterovirga sp. CN4-39 TaxID=3400910 RepID=UPI003C032F1D